MYCGGSEFKYPGTVAKNECSILLEICPAPNPTLNLPEGVDKCKIDIKTYLLMQPCYLNFLICRFERFCRNHSYTGFDPELLASQIRLHTP